ncbi:hypothetical protein PHLCEN_2v7812 [Hermanssonia centrifuga]|uniref:Protection of telomeres protein 1 ssDNA-binding domain-containing protein n=1 Tax=Hermanssonia centrifuga TaxID=98765 RepID=A0A2R6NVK9_9APHY|nr:hypothetical protein PHLCEN_2v7812 [Hermanssonia centrifuga]
MLKRNSRQEPETSRKKQKVDAVKEHLALDSAMEEAEEDPIFRHSLQRKVVDIYEHGADEEGFIHLKVKMKWPQIGGKARIQGEATENGNAVCFEITFIEASCKHFQSIGLQFEIGDVLYLSLKGVTVERKNVSKAASSKILPISLSFREGVLLRFLSKKTPPITGMFVDSFVVKSTHSFISTGDAPFEDDWFGTPHLVAVPSGAETIEVDGTNDGIARKACEATTDDATPDADSSGTKRVRVSTTSKKKLDSEMVVSIQRGVSVSSVPSNRAGIRPEPLPPASNAQLQQSRDHVPETKRPDAPAKRLYRDTNNVSNQKLTPAEVRQTAPAEGSSKPRVDGEPRKEPSLHANKKASKKAVREARKARKAAESTMPVLVEPILQATTTAVDGRIEDSALPAQIILEPPIVTPADDRSSEETSPYGDSGNKRPKATNEPSLSGSLTARNVEIQRPQVKSQELRVPPPIVPSALPLPHSDHDPALDLQAGLYIGEVLHGFQNENEVYSIYVTDYTANKEITPVNAPWCHHALADRVLKVEMWLEAAPMGAEMKPGDFIEINNIRMKSSSGGYLEATFSEGRKMRKLDADELEKEPHLEALLQRKKEWAAMAEEMGDRFPHKLFKDAEVDAHFGCTAEVLYISLKDNERAFIYVTDYTFRPDLAPIPATAEWVRDVDPDRIVKIALFQDQAETAKALKAGDIIAVRNVRLKQGLKAKVTGYLGGSERLIFKLQPNETGNVDCLELIKRKKEWTRELKLKREVAARLKSRQPKPVTGGGKPKKPAHDEPREILTIKEVENCTVCPALFRVVARIVAVWPPKIEDFVILHCTKCDQE